MSYEQDPDDRLDYVFNWARWLDGDVIASSSFAVASGLTNDGASKTESKTQIWLTGGTNGQTYAVTNSILTSGGRRKDRTINVLVSSTSS